jgi:hypothetical protein
MDKQGAWRLLGGYGLLTGILNVIWGRSSIDRFNMISGFGLAILAAIMTRRAR